MAGQWILIPLRETCPSLVNICLITKLPGRGMAFRDTAASGASTVAQILQTTIGESRPFYAGPATRYRDAEMLLLGERHSFGHLRYSYRSASIGSRREALMAGSMPLMSPTTIKIPVETSRCTGEIARWMSP